MSALNLTVDLGDNVDNVDKELASHPAGYPKARTDKQTRRSWMSLPWMKGREMRGESEPQGPRPFDGGTGYTEAKMAAILCDFLQPDTKLSHNEVLRSILALIPEKGAGSAEVTSFSGICVELAEQIPYHHPSQLKFAQLLSTLGRSPKFTSEYSLEGSPDILYGSHQRLGEALADATGFDETLFYDWVNINAFQAKLCAMGTWGATPGRSFTQLRYVFERNDYPRPKEQTEWLAILKRNTEIMAAALWFIWYGQTIFTFFIYDEDAKDNIRAVGNIGEIGDVAPFGPRSVERWQYWTRKFEEIEAWSGATDECKKLAAQAARLMHVIEENMVFSV